MRDENITIRMRRRRLMNNLGVGNRCIEGEFQIFYQHNEAHPGTSLQ